MSITAKSIRDIVRGIAARFVGTNFQIDIPAGGYLDLGVIRIYQFNTAITENVTATTAPAGSVAFTSHATGRTKTFYSDGAKWQLKVAV